MPLESSITISGSNTPRLTMTYIPEVPRSPGECHDVRDHPPPIHRLMLTLTPGSKVLVG
jgi:hypothetical protein